MKVEFTAVQNAAVLGAGQLVEFVPGHAVPAGQHVGLVVVPHGVVPAGQPHTSREASRQATPLSQQCPPHGVVPGGQQHALAGPRSAGVEDEHVYFFGQQALPQTWRPSGQVTAVAAPSGLSTAAPTAAAAAAPNTLRAWRLLEVFAIARVRRSKDSPRTAGAAGVLPGTASRRCCS